LVRGAGPVDGIPDLAICAELFGYGGTIEFLHLFCRYHGIEDSNSKVETWIDNRAAIRRVNRTKQSHARRYKLCHDADIVVHITERLTASSLRHRLGWVKLHQDKQTPYNDLDQKGCMNVDADALADIFRLKMESGQVKPITEGGLVDAVEVTLTIEGRRVPSHLCSQDLFSCPTKETQKVPAEKTQVG